MHRGGGSACRREQTGERVNLKAFFVAALSSALDVGVAVPDDVIRHTTPEVLSQHLPRPLWARLLTACLGAPRVDAQLIVETVGVPNLCEHVPAQIIWACIQEIAQRSLAGSTAASVSSVVANAGSTAAKASDMPFSRTQPTPVARPLPLATPPPPAAEPRASATPPTGTPVPIPAPGSHGEHEPEPSRGRPPVGQRFRPTNTGVNRATPNTVPSTRRPQAQATQPTPPVAAEPPRPKRGQTEGDFDLETFVGGKDDWKNVLAVEDEQLVDWSASEETVNKPR